MGATFNLLVSFCFLVCLSGGKGAIIGHRSEAQSSSPCPDENTSTYCLDPPNYPDSIIRDILLNSPHIHSLGFFQNRQLESTDDSNQEHVLINTVNNQLL